MQPMLSAILLAVGESKRMGEPKQLMPFGQSTLLEQAINNLMNSAVDEIIVVLGYKAEEVIKT
jgi:molybdenum cofactor cytidylyltransferase